MGVTITLPGIISNFDWVNNSVDCRLHSSLACWKSCYCWQSDLWRCFTCNIGWTNCLLHRYLFRGFLSQVQSWVGGICFRLHTCTHCLDLGFQSQFPNGLASSNTHCPARMGHLHHPKHSDGSIFGIYYPARFFPKI